MHNNEKRAVMRSLRRSFKAGGLKLPFGLCAKVAKMLHRGERREVYEFLLTQGFALVMREFSCELHQFCRFEVHAANGQKLF